MTKDEDRETSGGRPMRVMRAGDRRSASRSATRALDILELFGQLRRPLRAVEIVHRLEIHPSTANQLLKTMVESAHLAFDASSKTYLPSPRLAQFSRWLVETYGADERLRDLVRRIQLMSGEVVTLTTPNDLFMQVVDIAGNGDNPADVVERGLRVSIFGSATGAAYLSTLSSTQFHRLATRARIEGAKEVAIRHLLAGIRRDGFASSPSPDGTLWSVAAPLQSVESTVPLVIGLAGPTDRVESNLSRLGTLLRCAVAQMAEASEKDDAINDEA